MSASPTTPPSPALTAHRAADVDRYVELTARLRRRVEGALPPDIREELSGVTAYQCEALVRLTLEGPTSMHELARHQGVSVSTCTALVDRLQRQGLVERGSDPSDRRVVRVVPTERGAAMVRGYRSHKRRIAMRVLGALDAAELQALLASVERMLAVDLAAEDPA